MWSDIHFSNAVYLVPFVVADILSWKNKTLSGGILGGVTVLWVLFELTGYSLATFFCHILMLLMITLFTWSKSAGLTKR
jgi:hypothetical protein